MVRIYEPHSAVASFNAYTSLPLSNFSRASITRRTHANREPKVNHTLFGRMTISLSQPGSSRAILEQRTKVEHLFFVCKGDKKKKKSRNVSTGISNDSPKILQP